MQPNITWYCVWHDNYIDLWLRETSLISSSWFNPGGGGGGGGTRPENWWGCAAGRWKLDPKRSRKKLNLGPKRLIFVKIGSFCTPKDSFAVGGWEKVPQKDRARSCQSEKRGSKPRHICITHHIGSTPPPRGFNLGACVTTSYREKYFMMRHNCMHYEIYDSLVQDCISNGVTAVLH